MKININNFYNPSEKYSKEWSDIYDAYLLFNADLINFVFLFLDEREDNDSVDSSYSSWCNYYEVNLSKDEIINKFNAYSTIDFVNLMQHIYDNSKH